MTRGAVRCSAWLGVRLDSEETGQKSLETSELAGDIQATGGRKLATTERMEGTKDQNRRPVENGGRTGDENVALTGGAAEPRGSGVQLTAEVEREASNGADANNSEQTGEKRGIGIGVSWRRCWESSWLRCLDERENA